MASSQLVVVEIYLEEVLGVGSYGKVCKAKCGQLPCAAKLLHDTMFQVDQGMHSVFLQKFEQECQFLSSIKHPNIVQYLASVRVVQSNMPALLMELMDESLTRFLERSPEPLPYHIQLGICHDIALALAYLHVNAIIHRDLSSNNVLVIGAGIKAKVTDFGMSKIVDANTRMTPLTQCPGTLVYMPPEALTTPLQYSDKLDCFSHGVLTIQIITRNFPNPGDAHAVVQDYNYPHENLLRQIPETVRRRGDIDLVDHNHTLLPVALACLENKSEDRPSADELCVRLLSLKGELRYALSVEQAKAPSTTIDSAGWEFRVQQEKQLATKYYHQVQVLEQTIAKLEQELSEKKTMLEVKSTEIKKLKKELETKDLGEAGSLTNFQGLSINQRTATCVAPDCKIQKDKIKPILERKRVKKGDTWYIVDLGWMKDWKEYVGYDDYLKQSLVGQEASHPGPVDTSTLLKGSYGGELKENLCESTNFFLLPASAWDLLVSWYGLGEGSTPLSRKVVEYKHLAFTEYKVEVYFLEFNLCIHSDENHMVKQRFSRATSLAQLKEKMREIFSISRDVECRLWYRDSNYPLSYSPYKLVAGDPTWTVQDAGMQENQQPNVLLEMKNANGRWPKQPST